MYRVIIVCALIGVMYADAIALHSEKQKTQEQLSNPQSSFTTDMLYSSTSNNYSVLAPYYPTYPEYKNYSEEHKNYSTVSMQKNPRWLPGRILTSLLSLFNNLIFYGKRASIYLLSFLLTALLGGAFTTLVCTFTQICNTSIPGLGVYQNQIKEQIAELAGMYIRPEYLNAAVIFMKRAMNALQHENYVN